MMSGISNKKFLALFAMVAACMAASSFSTVNAAGVRRRRSSNERQQYQQQNNRSLKSSKAIPKAGSNAGSKGSSNSISADPSSVSVPENTVIIVSEPKVVHPMSIEGFGIKCPSETDALDSCLGQNEGNNDLCKTCLIGLATLASADESGLRSCSGVQWDSHCKEGCYTETQNYFNCGADKNFGVASTPATDTTPTTTTGTTTTAGSNSVETGGGTGTGTSADTFTIHGYAPATVCPMDTPKSGDSCVMQEYQYLDCYFVTDKIRCTCRHEEKKYLCNAE